MTRTAEHTGHCHAECHVPHDFEDCRNVETGAVFIIASGASAKDFPIEQFAHIPMITMNGAISMFRESGIKPYFYTCTDTGFSRQQPELFELAMRLSQRVALWEDHAQSQSSPKGKLYVIAKATAKPGWREYLPGNKTGLIRRAKFGSRNKTIGFSKNLKNGFFDARTVAYLALQIAYHLGFTKVYLVGVDLNQNAGRFYERNGESNSPCGLDDYFESRILPSLSLMSKEVMGKDFSVYNLSTTSRIPDTLIPRITLAEVTATLC
ncbi:KDO transferase-3 [Pseudomonas sp. ok272]|uniref:lipopolysaccharide biosynthesis protein n=1 Tax=unclassified Pseudomonas TaxID=196821 RepID=UPI0008ADB033|nr:MULTISPECIES: lipopolysaccharide biosynthesis protein [unclassified Pseudomonas]SEN57416.1 KDO transferase-3 [Pseudomonas sp. ok272]SFN36431.1 KDO transferase-3 [Pseudomonas sp. ok602]